MRHSTHVKPISYLKAHAADVLDQLAREREPLAITQHGEVKAVIQDIHSYEQTQDSLALLKILALGRQEWEAGEVVSAEDALRSLKARYGGV